MDPKTTPQAIVDKLAEYQTAEAMFIDACVRTQWPRWFIALAESGDGFFHRMLTLFIARFSGLESRRNQNNVMEHAPKGFRPGMGMRMVCHSIVTRIFKHQKPCRLVTMANREKTRVGCTDACLLDKKEFIVDVPLTEYGDRNPFFDASAPAQK